MFAVKNALSLRSIEVLATLMYEESSCIRFENSLTSSPKPKLVCLFPMLK